MPVKISTGMVQGIETAVGTVYKAIPYARPPVGELRFCPPQPVQSWDGVRLCDKFAPMALQKPEEPDSFYGREFFADPAFDVGVSEDCLYLNIWVPGDAKDCPVAVWYHGGGFQNGSGAEMEFDGEAFNRRGVILVTVNYRLGLAGFFCHHELRAGGVSGNWGLLDQIAALDWVRGNIAQFGGNADNITIFGQSAGGMAVRDLISSPMVWGKVNRAILQSCNGHKGPLKVDFQMEKMERISEKFLKRKRLTVNQLKNLSAEELLRLQKEYNFFAGFWTRSGLSLTPVIDKKYVPMNPDRALETGATARVGCMVGSTKNDLTVGRAGVEDAAKSKLHTSLLRLAGMHTAQGLPSYAYRFERRLPGDMAGAFHSSELWYVFGTLNRCWRPMEQADKVLSAQMTDAWTRFMKTGDPGWEPCTGEAGFYHVFDTQS